MATVGLFVSQKDNWANGVLDNEYEFINAENTADALRVLAEQYETISFILVDIDLAKANDFAFLKTVNAELKYSFIPVLGITDAMPTDSDAQAIKHGAVSLVSKRAPREIIESSVNNAIRIKDSKTFLELEQMLKELPSLIYVKDSEGKYIFSTHIWHHLEHDDDNWTIRGKTDIDIRKDRDNAIMAMEMDKRILDSGEGAHYKIMIDVDDTVEYYDVSKQPLFSAQGKVNGIIALLNNITEQELLRKKLEKLSITDGLTQLFNRAEIQRRIDETLSAEGSPALSLVMLDIDDFKLINDTYGHLQGDQTIVALAQMLIDICDTDDVEFSAGRWGGEEFMLLLPHTNASAAASIAEDIRKRFEETEYAGTQRQTVSIGVTEAREDDSLDTLLSRVDHALYEAKRSGKNAVCVF